MHALLGCSRQNAPCAASTTLCSLSSSDWTLFFLSCSNEIRLIWLIYVRRGSFLYGPIMLTLKHSDRNETSLCRIYVMGLGDKRDRIVATYNVQITSAANSVEPNMNWMEYAAPTRNGRFMFVPEKFGLSVVCWPNFNFRLFILP